MPHFPLVTSGTEVHFQFSAKRSSFPDDTFSKKVPFPTILSEISTRNINALSKSVFQDQVPFYRKFQIAEGTPLLEVFFWEKETFYQK